MELNRRGFLSGIFAAAMAPAIVKAENLMQVRKIILLDAPKAYEYDGNIWVKSDVIVREVDHTHIPGSLRWSFGDPYDAAIAGVVFPGNSLEDVVKRSRYQGASLSELRMRGVLK